MARPALRLISLCLLLSASVLAQPARHVLEGVPAGANNVLVLRDVLPHVEAFLKSERLRGLFRDIPLLAEEASAMGFGPDRARGALGLIRGSIPREVVLATDGESLLAVVDGLFAAVAANLVMAIELEEDEEAQMRRGIVRGMRNVASVSAWGRIVARNERTAERWADAVFGALESVSRDAAWLRVQWRDDGATLVVRPGLSMAGKQSLNSLAKGVGLPTEGIEALSWTIEIRQEGDALTFQVGSSTGQLDPQTLGSLWAGRDEQVLYANLDAPAAIERTLELSGMLTSHLDQITPWLQARWPGLGLQLESVLGNIQSLSEEAQFEVTVGDELLIRRESDWTSYAETGVEIPDQLPAELVAALDPTWSFAAMAQPLDWALYSTFAEALDNATQRASREQARGVRGPLTERLTFLSENMAPLQRFLESDESAVFQPGCALIQGVATNIARVSVHGSNGVERAGFGPAGQVPGLAVLSLPMSPSAGWKFADRLTAELAEACGLASKPELREADLGLGVPTAEIAWIDLQSGDSRLAFSGEMRLHCFEHGPMLVLSTSTALSRAILARETKASPRQLSMWVRTEGAQWASFVDDFGGVMKALGSPDATELCGALGIDARFYENHRAAFEAWTQGLRRIGTVESKDSLEDWIYRERTTLRWAQ